MHIALVGTRGVPAAYGGFETAAEEIGSRLSTRGHRVTVYCRGRAQKTTIYRGMRTVDLPAIRYRTAETLSHTALSLVHAIVRDRPDVIIVFNAANSPLLPLVRIGRIPVALHTDGLEWMRGKWGPIGQRYYLMAEGLAVYLADELISDADGIAEYYANRYSTCSNVIRYGAELVSPQAVLLDQLGLSSGEYYLAVARMEPENHLDLVIDGFIKSATNRPLVVVGSVPYPNEYSRSIARLASSDNRVRLVGSIWDQSLLDALYSHAAVYFHGHSVGGTNPSLLRAMGAGAPVAAFDVLFNREVLAINFEVYWSNPSDVLNIISAAERNPEVWRQMGLQSKKRIEDSYQWETAADGYEDLCRRLQVGGPRRLANLKRLRALLSASRARDEYENRD